MQIQQKSQAECFIKNLNGIQSPQELCEKDCQKNILISLF